MDWGTRIRKGVTLLGLAAGYELGGHWADKKADFQKLAWILLTAGTFTLLIASFGRRY